MTTAGAPGTNAEGTVSDTAVHVPPPGLRPYVERYVGYRLAGFPAGEHRGLPSRHLTVVLPFDEPLRVSWLARPESGATSFETLIGGLHRTPALIHHSGHQHGIQLSLTTAGVRLLFGVPSGALASLDIPLVELWPGADALRERLEQASSWRERFDILDLALTELAAAERRGAASMPAETRQAWHLLSASNGNLGVAELAREVGWSRRHLGERFRAEFGMPPKVTARIMRFERSRALLLAAPRLAVADVAASCGYADQAHLAREWSEMAGASPTAWLAGEELPVVGDEAPTGT